MENKKFTILCVDDEQSILNALKRLLRKEGYHLFFANSGKEGLELLKNNEIHMVISDQRMPEMSGTEFLSAVKDMYPDIFRVILTGYSDIDSITESINKGNIYKFFFKPWDDPQLKSEIRQILEQFELKQVNRKSHATVGTQNQDMPATEKSHEKMVDVRTHELELQNHMLQLSHAILEDLPICVVGIDIEGVIVTANKKALKVLSNLNIEVGRTIGDCFPETTVQNVFKVFETGEQIKINRQDLKFNDLKATLRPLSGSFKGKGVIMTIL